MVGKTVYVGLAGVRLGPGLLELFEGAIQQGGDGEGAAGFEDSLAFRQDGFRADAPLDHQVAKDQVGAVVGQGELFGVCVKPGDGFGAAGLGLLQHAGGQVCAGDGGIRVLVCQFAGEPASAAAEVQDACWFEVSGNAGEHGVAHGFLQAGGAVVGSAGAAEAPGDAGFAAGSAFGTGYCRQIAIGIHTATDSWMACSGNRERHWAKAFNNRSTCASECAALRVTRNRASPSGTVGGRMAVTSMPCSSSARLSASAA